MTGRSDRTRELMVTQAFNTIWTAVFFVIFIIPTAMVLRVAGKDPLNLRPGPQTSTYWVDCRHRRQS
ncbi:hypothetical protein D3877_28775 [Azospirillum cavernae]|uniref:Uncharacterized protein n=1 Tax=Azospirillum cavernae TaxID=2320860 RepID=A0A418VLB8_9PROT|nr:hypothetical protein D3877_28775 [Azospirillum cavernae]